MKTLMTLTLSILLAGSAFAQSTKGQGVAPADQVERLTQRMTKQLSLEPAQVKEVNAINLKYAEQLLSQRRSDAASDPRTDNASKIEERMNEELRNVLDPSQYQVWQRIQTDSKMKTEDGREIKSVQGVE